MFWGDDVQPSWVEAPFIPGHEFCGRIVEMGENVTGFAAKEEPVLLLNYYVREFFAWMAYRGRRQ